jgi:hypothetical protein
MDSSERHSIAYFADTNESERIVGFLLCYVATKQCTRISLAAGHFEFNNYFMRIKSRGSSDVIATG